MAGRNDKTFSNMVPTIKETETVQKDLASPFSITLIAQTDKLDNTDGPLWCDKMYGMT